MVREDYFFTAPASEACVVGPVAINGTAPLGYDQEICGRRMITLTVKNMGNANVTLTPRYGSATTYAAGSFTDAPIKDAANTDMSDDAGADVTVNERSLKTFQFYVPGAYTHWVLTAVAASGTVECFARIIDEESH